MGYENLVHYHNKEKRIGIHYDALTREKYEAQGNTWTPTGEIYSAEYLREVGAIDSPASSLPSEARGAIKEMVDAAMAKKFGNTQEAAFDFDSLSENDKMGFSLTSRLPAKVLRLKVDGWSDAIYIDNTANRKARFTSLSATVIDQADLNNLIAMAEKGELDNTRFRELLHGQRRDLVAGQTPRWPRAEIKAGGILFKDFLVKVGGSIAEVING